MWSTVIKATKRSRIMRNDFKIYLTQNSRYYLREKVNSIFEMLKEKKNPKWSKIERTP